MFDDDAPAKKPTSHEVGADLSVLSIDELENRIRLLNDEIQRIEKALSEKKSSLSAAEGFFKS
ncbi:MAG: DUF1192 domain-containing protein [Pseudomonadota bacterium]